MAHVDLTVLVTIFITVSKIPGVKKLKGVWIGVSEVSMVGWPHTLGQASGWREGVMEENCSSYGGQEADKAGNGDPVYPSKAYSQLPISLSEAPTSQRFPQLPKMTPPTGETAPSLWGTFRT
jgi:hypothetical protein